ncbi:MAG: SEC-C domain-containing protein [Clostridium sp.]|jgi:preprotein translocase subunit SecA|uniref:SEC-C metal-binding domain-containing protein n=1 Tax=Clostridium sp. TaxID=1506 RepID=UPI0025BC533A|nr:SEC-C metal-binding domain-containing protein [Clostridium sp.]MCH3965588.1 SEC-C domain-containing protein [Clostridium sp.]MCI1716916.1 SEC-C domain-containing protein [Clostridium sp.]MCI1801154.1 SEC-C domain-containing protein [Clostridium sp.]MCI1815102.1 SEC-C domain-containing protein [Clostridium sp.]MCI1872005.1 SEC-C domain-containing protein [Clostridium sp.]
MSLYKDWTDTVVKLVKTKGEAEFWKEYGSIEKNIYTKILTDHRTSLNGNIKNLSQEFNISPVVFIGFLDGINDSLEISIELEKLDRDSNIDVKINFEKLYFNMLDAKADYLYKLPQWESIFSKEKRKSIHKSWVSSKTIINKNKIGRNDPCPCGSGKKYKNCCGKTT